MNYQCQQTLEITLWLLIVLKMLKVSSILHLSIQIINLMGFHDIAQLCTAQLTHTP